MTDTTTPTGQALAKVETGPRALVKTHQESFAAVLPSHIVRPETWIRLAQSALRKGKRNRDGQTDLEVAAQNNTGQFLATLLHCASLGLEPGTDQYYLTPRKVKGKLEILGIVGYQGYLELMFRAGAISTAIAECVYVRDLFIWNPGSLDTEMLEKGRPPRWQGPQTRPLHKIDWDADRGALRLVYAYAVMKDGATSKVVVLNGHDIARIKAKAQNPDGDYSPWKNTPDAMWLKSSVRQLQKWVPTSAEYRNQQTQAKVALTEQTDTLGLPEPSPDDTDASADWGTDDDVVEAELVDDEPRTYADDDPERPFDEPPASFS